MNENASINHVYRVNQIIDEERAVIFQDVGA